MEQASAAALLGIIVGHWDANENGTHRVRDVTLREDACRNARPKAARTMVTLRKLANGRRWPQPPSLTPVPPTELVKSGSHAQIAPDPPKQMKWLWPISASLNFGGDNLPRNCYQPPSHEYPIWFSGIPRSDQGR